MTFKYTIELEFLLRLIVAGVCGAFIGYERKNRLKEAGIRTHFIVALGSALIMIVSKYGFYDIMGIKGISLDPSRIAAQVVSGIGFLGAGMIFVKNQSVNGLTTAAGIWATAGVGITIGSGMYLIGIAAAIIIIIAQVILHGKFNWLRGPRIEQVILEVKDTPNTIECIQKQFYEEQIKILNFKSERMPEDIIYFEITVKIPKECSIGELIRIFGNNPLVKSIEI